MVSAKQLEWIEERLKKKHPNYLPKAIKSLARTILSVESGHDIEDDFEEPSQTEDDINEEKEREKQERFAQETEERLKLERKSRIEQMGNSPTFRTLFNCKQGKAPDVSGVNAIDRLGQTALHRAAARNNLTLCKTLVEKDHVNPQIKDLHRNTAYAIAVREGFTKIAKYLIQITLHPAQTPLTDPISPP